VSGPTGSLRVRDGISVILGIVIGVSLFKAPAPIFASVDGPWQGLAIWALGGVLSLVGALCYAELAAADPRPGGDYVYLSRAYSPGVGFLFGWAQLVAVLTGSLGAVAYVFADYARVWLAGASPAAIACAAVVALTVPNVLGVKLSRGVQNGLTALKLLGLGALVLAGWLAPAPAPVPVGEPLGGVGFALILVLYAYGGWNDAAFVAAEVHEPRRNVPRVLIGGTALVLLLYLLVNAAYLAALGFGGLRASSAPAADVLAAVAGDAGGRAMSLLVMLSALGAIQGLVFTGARITASVGADHPIFAGLGRWHPRLGTPARALGIQALVSVAWILGVGSEPGRAGLDALAAGLGLPALPWERFGGGFETLVAGTAPVFWGFFLATGVALLVLRRREPELARPFRVPLYPWTPLLFCASCLYMLHASLDYAGALAAVGLIPVALGLPLYGLSRRAAGPGGPGSGRA
jgi:amino acid transporter